jgi:hypothetical protein
VRAPRGASGGSFPPNNAAGAYTPMSESWAHNPGDRGHWGQGRGAQLRRGPSYHWCCSFQTFLRYPVDKQCTFSPASHPPLDFACRWAIVPPSPGSIVTLDVDYSTLLVGAA